jgi:hypothetical protein
MEISATRTFNLLYIYLDLVWLVVFCGLLWVTRKRLELVVGLAAGVLYFLVDYGIFYATLGTREVTGGSTFWVLLWLSFSYGITNFAWIWILLSRNRHWVEWSTLIIGAWLTIALMSQNFGMNFPDIMTTRGTSTYHGVMAAILFIGYAILAVYNLRHNLSERVPLLHLLAIGIGIQFSWEAVLLVTGIRPTAILPMVVNSLVETNLGMPYAYLIYKAIDRRRADRG